MPIDYFIDHGQRLVSARGWGVFSDADIFTYQREVWSRPDVQSYDELVDTTAVEAITAPPGKDRPTDFSAKVGTERTLSVWKREKTLPLFIQQYKTKRA